MVPLKQTVGVGPPAAEPKQLGEIALIGIYEVSKILAKPARLETTLSGVLHLLSSFLDMQHGTIVLLDDDDVPGIAVGSVWTEEVAYEGLVHLPRKVLDQIIATAMPLVLENAGEHPLFKSGEQAGACATIGSGQPVSFIGVPIKIEDRVVGTLSIVRVWDKRSEFRSDHDVRFLSMIANLIGQTIHLHRVIARDRERLMDQSRRLEKELTSVKPGKERARVAGIIGESAPLRALLNKIEIVAKSNATVLLRGESGTGKELCARAIHELSPRSKAPFVKVNCAALPESVLESELFGHEKGAFTGAIASRKGRFEIADGGTIFLDEIGEISPAFQAKLLRVLQEGEFDRVGSTKTQKVDVRVVAATNRDLEEAVKQGTFRADLYYRISVVPLRIPSLRERKGDIPILAESFLKRFNKENGRNLKLASSAIDVLKACYFPGNVRELENCVFRTATLATGVSIVEEDFACRHDQCLSALLWNGSATPLPERPQPQLPLPVMPASAEGRGARASAPVEARSSDAGRDESPVPSAAQGSERERLIEAMEKAGWVQAKAARILGLTPRQIGYALKKHGIEIRHF
ncbi:MAG: nif-specific transcriptional activator NifA [Hyphomicrobium sp.]|uniref:nif-specific transcriptional activator NifA n=1 Tax=Hyphomicrobium sp. TaxID=82 RepID=UPI001329746F|nr:nif-specific transcriptional activator NifA [Hyphomicrobium sp.]KAB2944023.1 MAG: nif-specific transcriptional activator NifA [Hyphomicrobium sp.]MBZ0209315.1 nif-specific transcriptional activator NifA [Hyphomicrobium sp.]